MELHLQLKQVETIRDACEKHAKDIRRSMEEAETPLTGEVREVVLLAITESEMITAFLTEKIKQEKERNEKI